MSDSVKIIVDTDALETLMDSDFNLCLTRDVKVGEKIFPGNVVFAMVPTKRLAPQMELVWEDKYQVFETTLYEGVKVTSGTRFIDVKLGQKATFDPSGNAEVTGEEDQNKPLRVRNEWKEDARVGVRSYDPNTGTYNSLFISPEILTEMMSDLTPIKKFSVFWNQHLVTDTIIDDTVSDPYIFGIIAGEGITIKYSKERPHWSRV